VDEKIISAKVKNQAEMVAGVKRIHVNMIPFVVEE
jgi:hypothetical protein